MIYSVLANIIVSLIGYLFGSINAAIIISKLFFKNDVRKTYSKNAGATNMARNFGKKISISTFLIDVFKVVIALIIVWSLKKFANTWYWDSVIVQFTGLFAMIGHIFPIFFKFKGGKGVAAWWGFVLTFNFILALIAIIIGYLILKIYKIVSLGSITVPTFIAILAFIPFFGNGILTPILNEPTFWTTGLFLIVMAIIIIITHIENIKRLIHNIEK